MTINLKDLSTAPPYVIGCLSAVVLGGLVYFFWRNVWHSSCRVNKTGMEIDIEANPTKESLSEMVGNMVNQVTKK